MLSPGGSPVNERFGGGGRREIPNNHVWIFTGGEPPNAFLRNIGVAFGPRDLTAEARAEARLKGIAA